MKIYAVVDTNVIVSALITKNPESPTRKIFRAMLGGGIIPLYNEEILGEYGEVLGREKFHLEQGAVQTVLNAIRSFGIEVNPESSEATLIDQDDLVFYEVVMEKRDEDAYLITGNLRHFPIRPFIVTPAEMLKIMETHGIGE